MAFLLIRGGLQAAARSEWLMPCSLAIISLLHPQRAAGCGRRTPEPLAAVPWSQPCWGLRSPVAVTPSTSSFSILSLDADLQVRLMAAAARQGVSLSTLCEQWLVEELERHEHAHGVDGAGRCSVRTGLCTSGPVPLPLQQ
jgi:hypothetical protein